MLRSLYSAVSGVKGHQTYLDVTGNNIANVNTVGFRKSVVQFQDLLYQKSRGASAPDSANGYGGTNPMQVGLGVSIAAIETVQTQGPLQYTGNRNDLAVQGDGFFVVTNGQRKLFTRSGAAVLDDEGNFVMSGTGFMYQGFKYEQDPTNPTKFIASGSITNINIPLGEKLEPRETTLVGYRCNLDSRSQTYLPSGVVAKDAQITLNVGGTAPIILNNIYAPPVVTAGAPANTAGTIDASAFLVLSDVDGNNKITLSYQGLDTTSGFPKLDATFTGPTGTPLDPATAKYTYDSTTGTLTIINTGVTPNKTQKIEISKLIDFTLVSDSSATPSENYLVAFRPATDGSGNMLMEWWPESVPNPALPNPAIVPPTTPVTVPPTVATVITIPTNTDGTFSYTPPYNTTTTPPTIIPVLPGVLKDLASQVKSTGDKWTAINNALTSVTTYIGATGTAGPADTALGTTTDIGLWLAVPPTGPGMPVASVALYNAARTEAQDMVTKTSDALTDAQKILQAVTSAGCSTNTITAAQTAVTKAQAAVTAATKVLAAITNPGPYTPLGYDGDIAAAVTALPAPSFVTDGTAVQTLINAPLLAGGDLAVANAAYTLAVSNLATAPVNTYSLKNTVDGKGMTMVKGSNSVGTVNQRTEGTHVTKLDIYDSLGNSHTLELIFEKIDNNKWSWRAFLPTEPGIGLSDNKGVITFGPNGLITSKDAFTIGINFASLGAEDATVKLDFSGKSFDDGLLSGVTQFGSSYTTKAYYQDGYTMGVLQDYATSQNGTVTGVYSNGQRRPLYQIALALFSNPQGLNQEGNSVFSDSANSGAPQIGKPQENGAGSIMGSTLEMSNVDLSEEFVRLIVAQRGFQANARVITTSDQVLEELINLKR